VHETVGEALGTEEIIFIVGVKSAWGFGNDLKIKRYICNGSVNPIAAT
jgi:hypothetical protein